MPAPKKKPSGVRTSLRFDPPSLEEAIYAAQGLTDDIDGQAEIAARLMGVPEGDVRAAILKMAPARSRLASRPLSAEPRVGITIDLRMPDKAMFPS
jgi:hypothetical protein